MIQSSTSIPSIAGLVLCGGDSKRMGTDKGLILKDGIPWFLHIGNLLQSLALPVLYSIRSEQLEAYRAYVDAPTLIIDDDISEGPLRGLLSAMNATIANSLLVVACDMPDLDRPIIESLLDISAQDSHDFYAYSDGNFFQPFPAVYTRRGIAAIPKAASLQQLLQNGNTYRLTLPGNAALPNYNELV
jgi:molybdenum cofactor guanylyltransferase